jgi:hypothetical protein
MTRHSSLRPLLRFVLMFAVVFGALMAAWPVAGSAYAHAFRAVAQKVFGKWSGDARVQFVPGRDGFLDSEAQLFNRRSVRPGAAVVGDRAKFSTRYLGWMPTIFFVALAAASPVPWRRRFLALGLGLALVHLLIAANLFTFLHHHFAQSAEALGLPPYGPTARAAASRAWALFEHLGFPLALVVLVWLGVTFRRADYARLIEAASAGRRRAGKPGRGGRH